MINHKITRYFIMILMCACISPVYADNKGFKERKAMYDIFQKLDIPLTDASIVHMISMANAISAERLEIAKKLKAMEVLKKELNKSIQELNTLRKELDVVAAKQQKQSPNMKLVVTLYESVDPKKAANMLKRLDAEMVLAIIRMMSPRKSSQIIAAMDDRVAAIISKRLLESQKPQSGEGK